MGSKENSTRKVWQGYSGKNAGIAEQDFFSAFLAAFENTDFSIRSKPKEFGNIYVNVPLSKQELSEIHNVSIVRHGVFPDYAIDNITTGKTLYIEVKRQDGWVETGIRADGRGNAHERSCKFFTPGLLKILRAHGKLGEDVLPFWTVFQGNITRDPCRVREIKCWYDEYVAHYYFWRNAKDPHPLINHFNTHLKPLLM